MDVTHWTLAMEQQSPNSKASVHKKLLVVITRRGIQPKNPSNNFIEDQLCQNHPDQNSNRRWTSIGTTSSVTRSSTGEMKTKFSIDTTRGSGEVANNGSSRVKISVTSNFETKRSRLRTLTKYSSCLVCGFGE